MKIQALLIALLMTFSSAYTVANKVAPRANTREYTLTDFNEITIGMTYDEVVALLGEPTDSFGSGITRYYYRLSDGWWIDFEFAGYEELLVDIRIFDYRNDRVFTLKRDWTKEDTDPASPDDPTFSVSAAQARLASWDKLKEVTHLPDLDLEDDEGLQYGFLVDYSGYAPDWPGALTCCAMVNADTGVHRFEEIGYSHQTGRNLYGNLPDDIFPIPMHDGEAIPYKTFSPPDFYFGIAYMYWDLSVMESYQAQLKAAGFTNIDTGNAWSALWQYERDDGCLFSVGMFKGDTWVTIKLGYGE